MIVKTKSVIGHLLLRHVPSLPVSPHADPPRGPHVEHRDAPVVDSEPQPGVRGHLEAAAHEVADHVPVAHEDVDLLHGELGLDLGIVVIFVTGLGLVVRLGLRIRSVQVFAETGLDSRTLCEKCLKRKKNKLLHSLLGFNTNIRPDRDPRAPC